MRTLAHNGYINSTVAGLFDCLAQFTSGMMTKVINFIVLSNELDGYRRPKCLTQLVN